MKVQKKDNLDTDLNDKVNLKIYVNALRSIQDPGSFRKKYHEWPNIKTAPISPSHLALIL